MGAWAGALLVLVAPGWPALAAVALVVAVVGTGVVRRWWSLGWLGPLAAFVAVAGVAGLQHVLLTTSPLAALADEGAVVRVELELTSDVRVVAGHYGDLQVVRAVVARLEGRGSAWTLDAPVVVMAGADWPRLPLGTRLETAARLVPGDGDVAALVRPTGEPRVVAEPDVWWDAAAGVRRSVRAAVAGRDADARELVPALVVGDDGGLDPDLADDFRTTGLTHLLAVSGTNLTLVVGFLLVLGRWAGVRGPWLYALGVLGICGFVLTARAEPSVVRAAAMGAVALVGMGRNGRSRGVRGLGVAVLGLLLVWPRLAVTAGFALSALATAGILLLAPVLARRADAVDARGGSPRRCPCRWPRRWPARPWSRRSRARSASSRWAPTCWPRLPSRRRPCSVSPAGCSACCGARSASRSRPRRRGRPAGSSRSPVGAPTSRRRRSTGAPDRCRSWLLTALCLLAVPLAPRLLGRPTTTLACTGLLLVVMLVRPPNPGWPPRGWVLAMCDVGQGDALVLRAGPGAAVVVDAGPEPAPTDACLDRLEVTAVPLLVLTHFHADHVGGVVGVLEGREVGEVEGTALLDPPEAPATWRARWAATRRRRRTASRGGSAR